MKIPASLVLMVGATAALASAPAQQATYRARTNVVVIDAAVTDGRRPIMKLTQNDFELRDNGVVQQILDFSHESMPVDVSMVVDVSGSMTSSDRAVVQRAIGEVSRALQPTDRGGVTVFTSNLIEPAPMQHPPVPSQFPTNTGGSGSSIIDALLLSLVTPPVVDRRQFVLFMTDGQENTSFFDSRTLLETAKHTAAPTTIVLVTDRASGSARDVWDAVAATTGGEVIELKRKDTLAETFLTALENFRFSYLLRYTPTGVSPTGWHDVSVKVKSRSYRVRARRGYWGDQK